MTTASPPACQRCQSARAAGDATVELHHHPGHDPYAFGGEAYGERFATRLANLLLLSLKALRSRDHGCAQVSRSVAAGIAAGRRLVDHRPNRLSRLARSSVGRTPTAERFSFNQSSAAPRPSLVQLAKGAPAGVEGTAERQGTERSPGADRVQPGVPQPRQRGSRRRGVGVLG